MQPGEERFGPRSAGEIISAGFKIYFSQDFVRYLIIAAIGMVPAGGLSLALFALASFGETQADAWANAPYFILTVLLAPVGSMLLSIVITPIVLGAIAYGTVQSQMGRRFSAGEAYRFALGKARTLVSAFFLMGVVLIALSGVPTALVLTGGESPAWLLGGMILFWAMYPVLMYLTIRWLFILHAILLDGTGVLAAFKRSSLLVKGTWWRTFGIYLLASVVGLVAMMVINIPFSLIGGLGMYGSGTLTIFGIGVVAGMVLISPFAMIVVTLLYLDLRIRKEGDIVGALEAAIGGSRDMASGGRQDLRLDPEA